MSAELAAPRFAVPAWRWRGAVDGRRSGPAVDGRAERLKLIAEGLLVPKERVAARPPSGDVVRPGDLLIAASARRRDDPARWLKPGSFSNRRRDKEGDEDAGW